MFSLNKIQSNANSMSCSDFAATQCQDRFPADKVSLLKHKSPVIRQKAILKTGASRRQSTPNFPRNEYFLTHDRHTYVCVSGGKNFSFFGKFGVPCFLVTPVLRFGFFLITDEISDNKHRVNNILFF